MATIKDVAARAGVSHGTVTNVLNGLGNVKEDKVKRVMEAVEALNYTPSIVARNLKKGKSNVIGVVLPNALDSFFTQFYASVEASLASAGYPVILFTTGDLPERESQVIAMAENMHVQGLIIVTCQPDKLDYFKEINSHKHMKLVFAEREVDGLDCNFVGFEHDKSVHEAVGELLDKKLGPVGLIVGHSRFSSEKRCIDGYKSALSQAGVAYDKQYVRKTDYRNESGFQAAMELLQCKVPPKSILCSTTPLLEGAIGAMKWAGQDIELVSMGEAYWNDNRYPNARIIPRPGVQLGETVAQLLLDNIENPVFFDQKRVLMSDKKIKGKMPAVPEDSKGGQTLRILLPEDQMANALKGLLPDLKRRTGIDARLETYEYDALYSAIIEESKSSGADVFLFDLPWLHEYASNGYLLDMTSFIEAKGPETFLYHDMEQYMKFEGRFYGVPHRFTSQLLFYRKDLFENRRMQHMFYNRYKSELAPPRSWLEFNAIAKFFTREYNPESPTTYGYTTGMLHPSVAVSDFLPHLWAYGGDVFDEKGNVTLGNPEAVRAMMNYIEALSYTSSEVASYGWEEDALEFAQGDVAMLIEFTARTNCLADRNTSNIVGKIGFTNVPGETSVLGGWMFGINNKSKKKQAAFELIEWACGHDCLLPMTILSGISTTRQLYSSVFIQELYPWMNKAVEAMQNHVKLRELPSAASGKSIRIYEQIINGAIRQCRDGADPKQVMHESAESMRQLIGRGD